MMGTEVVTITRAEYADLLDKSQKWDNITDERITYIAWRTAAEWEQFKQDAAAGKRVREYCGPVDVGHVILDADIGKHFRETVRSAGVADFARKSEHV